MHISSPAWLKKLAKKIGLSDFFKPVTEKNITSERGAEKVLKAMSKGAAEGSTMGLRTVVQGAQRLLKYKNGSFYLPRALPLLQDALDATSDLTGQAQETYAKHASLLIDQSARVLVNEGIALHKADEADPLSLRNTAESMSLVLRTAKSSSLLAKALAVTTTTIKKMRAIGDYEAVSSTIDKTDQVLEDNKKIPTVLRGHFKDFMAKFYPSNPRRQEITVDFHDPDDLEASTPSVSSASAASVPSLSLVAVGQEAPIPSTPRDEPGVFVPASDFIPYGMPPVSEQEIVAPEVPPAEGFEPAAQRAVAQAFDFAAFDRKPPGGDGHRPPAARVVLSDGLERDGFTDTVVNSKPFMSHVDPSEAFPDLADPPARYTPEELASLVGVFERTVDAPGYTNVTQRWAQAIGRRNAVTLSGGDDALDAEPAVPRSFCTAFRKAAYASS